MKNWWLLLLVIDLTFLGSDRLMGQAPPIKYDHYCFTIHGKDTYIYSGEFHYFRCPKELWHDRLLKLKRAGLNCVSTYVPWNWHEQKEGEFDLKDLEDFLKLCEDLGLYIIVRPGPYICAEWDVGGYPRWLAAKEVRYRTNDPDYMRWAKHWYDAVLPVIRGHQITQGKNIVMVQIENGYGDGVEYKREYIRNLYKMVRQAGIDIPINTCWTACARDNKDPDMADIIDAPNLYVGWDMQGAKDIILAARREEYNAPTMVTELQGGWFSTFGGKLSSEQGDHISPQQTNALIKTALEAGCGLTNYYMVFGGTNFGRWGAKGITTTYDYHAPLKEPGGIWDKYYVVKGVGNFLELFGAQLVRAELAEVPPQADVQGVSVTQRDRGNLGFLFVRENQNVNQNVHITYTDPETKTANTIPQIGGLVLPARDMKILLLNWGLPNGMKIKYCTSEIQSISQVGERWALLVYGEKGNSGEICLQLASKPAEIFGELAKQVWDENSRTLTLNYAYFAQDNYIVIDNLVLAVLCKERALRTWELPLRDYSIPFVSNSYFLRDRFFTSKSLSMVMENLPGEVTCSLVLPLAPKAIRVNGERVLLRYDSRARAAHFRFAVEPLPQEEAFHQEIKEVKFITEGILQGSGWKDTNLEPLEKLGVFENGYTRYMATFTSSGAAPKTMIIRTYCSDPKLVYINDKFVPEASGDQRLVKFDVSKYLREGLNGIEILYENTGQPNGGKGMEDLKGLAGVNLLEEGKVAGIIELVNWRVNKAGGISDAAAEVASEFDDSSWAETQVGKGWQAIFEGYLGFAWYRKQVELTAQDIANKLTMLNFEGVDDNVWVFVNGQQVGEHEGWDEPFYFDISGLLKEGKNTIVVGVQNTGGSGGIHQPVYLSAAPLFSMGMPIQGWRFKVGLEGEREGYFKVEYDDSGWKTVQLGKGNSAGIGWYRFKFGLPKLEGWVIPWKLSVDAKGDALIYLNGILIGRYADVGPQHDFYLPECWLKAENVVAIAARGTANDPQAELYKITITPYKEFAVKRNIIAVSF